jgi:LysR family transcriptional regulator, hca operon transcriptional activator
VIGFRNLPLLDRLDIGFITRSELTAAGRAFLDHARLAVTQAEAAKEAARRPTQPIRPSLALGFLSGREMDLLTKVMAVLHDELPNIEVKLSSDYSPRLAEL